MIDPSLYSIASETTSAAAPDASYSNANTASVHAEQKEEEEENDDDCVFTPGREDLSGCESDDTTGSDCLAGRAAAAQIVKGPASVSTLVGCDVLLEALVIGRPEPVVRWLRGVSSVFLCCY